MNLKGKLSYAGPMGPTGSAGSIGPTGPAGKDAIADAYLKSAEVVDNTLVLTDNNNTNIEFSPDTGSAVVIDNATIITNADGNIETAVGGAYVDGLVEDKEIVKIKSQYKDVSSIITEDIFNEMVSYGDKLRADVSTGFGAKKDCVCSIVANRIITITPYEENSVILRYEGYKENGIWKCERLMLNGGSGWNVNGNRFYCLKNGKVPSKLKGEFLPIDNNSIILNDNLQLTSGLVSLNRTKSRLVVGKNNIYNNTTKENNIIISSAGEAMQGDYSTAIGANVQGNYNIGIGCSNSSSIYGDSSIMIASGGSNTNVYHSKCVIIGNHLSVDNDNQTIIGSWNGTVDSNTRFVVACGTDYSNRFNALTIDNAGNATFAGTVSPSGADYAEYFEWADGNTESEDRIGCLVALEGNKIKKANTTDEILGIISGSQSVAGDSAEMNWCNKYLKDEFDRIIYDEKTVHHDAIYDKDNVKVRDEYDETVRIPKINPDYNSELEYVPRSKRKEWGAVGLLGKIKVRYTGELSVGNYITAQNGIAIKSETKTNLRVLEIINDHIARILIK